MFVTLDVVKTRRLVLRALPVDAPGLRSARLLLGGAGDEVHRPWQNRPTTLRWTARRRDGWGRPDPRRLMLLACWQDDALPLPAGELLGVSLREAWRARLERLGSHGTIDGADPFADTATDRAGCAGRRGVTLTYGNGSKHVLDFLRRTNQVVEKTHQTPGLLASCNMFDRRGKGLWTFSCWDDLGAATKMLYADPEHRQAIRLARDGFYGAEMWFARLALVDSHGTIAGRDPFAAPRSLAHETS